MNCKKMNGLQSYNKYGIDQPNLTTVLSDELNKIRNSLIENKWSGPEPGTELFLEDVFNRVEKTIKSKI